MTTAPPAAAAASSSSCNHDSATTSPSLLACWPAVGRQPLKYHQVQDRLVRTRDTSPLNGLSSPEQVAALARDLPQRDEKASSTFYQSPLNVSSLTDSTSLYHVAQIGRVGWVWVFPTVRKNKVNGNIRSSCTVKKYTIYTQCTLYKYKQSVCLTSHSFTQDSTRGAMLLHHIRQDLNSLSGENKTENPPGLSAC